MYREELINHIIEAVQAELKNRTIVIVETTSLQDIKGFDSLVVVGLLDRLERQLNFEMDPALVLPETFASPRSIADAIMKSQ